MNHIHGVCGLTPAANRWHRSAIPWSLLAFLQEPEGPRRAVAAGKSRSPMLKCQDSFPARLSRSTEATHVKLMNRFVSLPALICCCIVSDARSSDPVTGPVRDSVQRIELLPPQPNNPRNSEGDFIRLKDGRLLLVYTHFTGGASDHAEAHLAGRYSSDGGKSWTAEDVVVIANEGNQNIMSVSLLRLASGEIALFYLRKNSASDCRPVMRISADEAQTWSDPVEMIPESENGYYVLNNNRVVQLEQGRLLAPLAQHYGIGWERHDPNASLLCYYSDDNGKTWKRGEAAPAPQPNHGQSVIAQEPGVVALKDQRLMMWCRTNAGSQYVCYSRDSGESWSRLQPSNMLSPLSPATIERIPSTGDLLLIWNDHREIQPSLRNRRTPLTAAISSDEGKTWKAAKTLEDNPHGWYCYTAMTFVDDQVLLAHCAGDRRMNNGLALTQVTRFPVSWIAPAAADRP